MVSSTGQPPSEAEDRLVGALHATHQEDDAVRVVRIELTQLAPQHHPARSGDQPELAELVRLTITSPHGS